MNDSAQIVSHHSCNGKIRQENIVHNMFMKTKFLKSVTYHIQRLLTIDD